MMGVSMTDKKIVDLIYNITSNSYCRAQVADRTWRRMIRYLLNVGYSELDTVKILYSKMVRWSQSYAVDPNRITLESFKMSMVYNKLALPEILASDKDAYLSGICSIDPQYHKIFMEMK